jgi:hypothetical protein
VESSGSSDNTSIFILINFFVDLNVCIYATFSWATIQFSIKSPRLVVQQDKTPPSADRLQCRLVELTIWICVAGTGRPVRPIFGG